MVDKAKGPLGCCSDGEIIALDGKQLRHSFDKQERKAAIYMVSAWAVTNRLMLGQVKVDEKSNEITASLNSCVAWRSTVV